VRARPSLRSWLILVVLAPLSVVAWRFGRGTLLHDGQAACVSRPAAPVPQRWAAAAARARAIACATLAPDIPGFAIAVAVDGRIVWSEAFGYADLEAKLPATPATQFRIGSVSKPLTAAAVAQLVESGKLRLDAPVQRYVPTFPDKGAPITTRLVAGHLAGIRHYRGDEFLLNRRFATVTEGLTVFQDDSLLFAPGTRYSYSTYGWNLISAVVEGASGEEFLAYMSRHVFGPLGMTSTAPDKNDSLIPNRSRFYERRTRFAFALAPAVDNSVKWAGGGFLSTAEDLVRFGSAHLAPGFLKAETLELLFTPQRTATGEATGYGVGWRVARDTLGHRFVSHGGGSVGGTTAFGVDRDSRVVFAVVTNLGRVGLADAQQIRALFDSVASAR